MRELEANNIRAALKASEVKIYDNDGTVVKLDMNPNLVTLADQSVYIEVAVDCTIIRTSCTTELTPSFLVIRLRWTSTVLVLIPS